MTRPYITKLALKKKIYWLAIRILYKNTIHLIYENKWRSKSDTSLGGNVNVPFIAMLSLALYIDLSPTSWHYKYRPKQRYSQTIKPGLLWLLLLSPMIHIRNKPHILTGGMRGNPSILQACNIQPTSEWIFLNSVFKHPE